MFIKPGEIISIRHHSVNLIKTKVIDVQDHESGGQVITIDSTAITPVKNR